MSSRLETLQVARLSPQLLTDSASLVGEFITTQAHPAGGFKDRDDAADLYYTVFGLDGLAALDVPLPVGLAGSIETYLRNFGDGETLDFVHFACLAHAWAAIGIQPAPDVRDAMLARLARHRSADGAFADTQASDTAAASGAIYSSFMAVGAYDNLGCEIPDAERLTEFLVTTARTDGAYAEGGDDGTPITTVTAAAVTLLRNLGRPVSPQTADWLRAQIHSSGGFLATPGAPMPDLLSTAVALHALAGLQADLEALAEPCLDFVDTLWTNRGAFHGHWADDDVDCEYTYYGLLALGHLSVWVR